MTTREAGEPSEEAPKKIDSLVAQAVDKRLKNLSDPEIFRALKHEYSDEVFARVRKQLLLWLAPFVAAVAFLGFDIYRTRADIRTTAEEIRTVLQQSKAEIEQRRTTFDYFFKEEQRVKTLKMLISDFYRVKTLHLPLDVVLQDRDATSCVARRSCLFEKVAHHHATAEFYGGENQRLFDEERSSPIRVDYALVIVAPQTATFSLYGFAPLVPLSVHALQGLQRSKVTLTLVWSGERQIPRQDRLTNPYNYSSRMADATVNNILILPALERKRIPELSGDTFVSRVELGRLGERSTDIDITMNFAGFFRDVVRNYESYHVSESGRR